MKYEKPQKSTIKETKAKYEKNIRKLKLYNDIIKENHKRKKKKLKDS